MTNNINNNNKPELSLKDVIPKDILQARYKTVDKMAVACVALDKSLVMIDIIPHDLVPINHDKLLEFQDGVRKLLDEKLGMNRAFELNTKAWSLWDSDKRRQVIEEYNTK